MDFSGILVPGGFGVRGTEGKIQAISWARKQKKPFLGKGSFWVTFFFILLSFIFNNLDKAASLSRPQQVFLLSQVCVLGCSWLCVNLAGMFLAGQVTLKLWNQDLIPTVLGSIGDAFNDMELPFKPEF